MALSEKQVGRLKDQLPFEAVKQRKQGKGNVDYIEGWYAIAVANDIFGFDNWSLQTLELVELHQPYKATNQWNKTMQHVAFRCKVRITVIAGDTVVQRDGIGFGNGIAGDIQAAYELAIKEAETDAMKRALRTFGNQFGLSLYDKEKVGYEAPLEGDDPTLEEVAGAVAFIETQQRLLEEPQKPEVKSTYALNKSGAWKKLMADLQGVQNVSELTRLWHEYHDVIMPRDGWNDTYITNAKAEFAKVKAEFDAIGVPENTGEEYDNVGQI